MIFGESPLNVNVPLTLVTQPSWGGYRRVTLYGPF